MAKRLYLTPKYVSIVLFCGAIVVALAIVQHRLVLGIDPRPLLFVIPAIVGLSFGMILVFGMMLRARQNEQMKLIAARDAEIMALNDGLESRVAARTRELASSEHKFRHLFNSMRDGIYLWEVEDGDDAQLRLAEVNDTALAMLGRQRASLMGIHPTDLDAPDTIGQVSAGLDLLLNDTPVVFENVFQRHDGAKIPVEMSAHAFKLNGAEVVLAVVRDLTEQKAAEAERLALQGQLAHRSRMDAIGQLAGGVAHDFNNMLGGILGAADLLRTADSDLDPECMSYVDLIIQAGEQAMELAARLLAFGRAGDITLKPLEFHKVIESAVAILRRTVNKGIKITIQAQAERHLLVGDQAGLQNALINLGINAGHAMPDGGHFSIQTRNVVVDAHDARTSAFDIEPGDYLEIQFRDDGCGIPPTEVERIFEPFFTTKALGHGTGLGLASVYGTTRDHHGEVTVKSEVGVGTVFTIRLPLTNKPLKQTSSDAPITKGVGLLLFVDDEEVIRVTSGAMLSKMGYDVLFATDGAEAIEVFRAHRARISLVILDLAMPGLSGAQVFRQMKAIDGTCRVVISSGHGQRSDLDLDALTAEGLAGFIAKPYGSAELSLVVASAIS